MITDLKHAIEYAIYDPGKRAGFRGDRHMSDWQADAVIDVLREFDLLTTQEETNDG